MVTINTNLAASSATRNLSTANAAVSSSIAKLSSGNRVIKASDDVAGLAIGTSIASTVKTLQIALLNTQQASSVLSIADGALSQIGDILSRQQSIAAQATSGSLGTTERGYLNQEFQALISEVDRIVGSTSFNGITLLNGTLGANSTGLDVSNAPVFGSTTTLYSGTVGTSAVNGTPAIAISNDNGNGSIIGSTADIKISGVFNANNVVYFTLNLNGVTYNSAAVDLATANTARTVTFTNPNDSGATIAFSVNKYGIPADQNAVNTLAAAIQDDLDGLTIYQSRTFSTGSGGITSTALNGTILAGIDGGDFTLKGTSFDTTDSTAPVVSSYKVTAETTDTDGQISVQIGGVTYRTIAGLFNSGSSTLDSTDFDNDGDSTANNDGGAGVVRLYKDGDATANPNEYLQIDFSAATPSGFGIDTDGGAQLVEDALNKAFGVGSNGALSFQVGAAVTDAIAVSIDSVKTTDIYVDNDGNAQDLDVTTQENAQTAIEVLTNAVAAVISRRADVGAAQSRFNFAAANLETSISNQDSARGSFLDDDIASESTIFASAQVRLQASTSVLAQANALPRDLLRLLQ